MHLRLCAGLLLRSMRCTHACRMLEKQAGLNQQAQATNPLLMHQQQQMLTEALTSGLPAPHLATTPKPSAGLPTSAAPAGAGDVNVGELLAAAAAAAAAANSAPMAGPAGGDLGVNPALLAASAAGMRPGAMGHMMNPAASAGLPHMPPPGSLSSMHQRAGGHGGMNPYAHKAHMAGHGGPAGQQGGIGAGRQHGNAQAAAAAAAIAAVAAQGAGPYGPDGPATDSQGNILPLRRLQEIWSRGSAAAGCQ